MILYPGYLAGWAWAHTQHIMDLTEALLSLTVCVWGGIMCLTSCMAQVALPTFG